MKLEFESYAATAQPYIGNNYPVKSFDTDAAKIPQLLEAGIRAAQEGNRHEARPLLIQVTEADPQNETAWLWMASISEYPEELIIFLNNVLSINPKNARALEWMAATKSLLAKTFVQRGVDASNDANMDFARQCFLQAIVHDPESEMAWFWLASIADSTDEKIAHLQKVLSINPENDTAKVSMKAAKEQLVESTLKRANSAAVGGERETARELLAEVFKHAPELEEAWILKSYLADSFSEKITCFEKVLSLNPNNEMAISGLASLREMMAKTEAKRAEQAALLAAMEASQAEEQIIVVGEDQIIYDPDAESNHPTQELQYPPDFNPFEDSQNDAPNSANENSTLNHAQPDRHNLNREQTVSQQPVLEERFTADDATAAVSAEHNFMENNLLNQPTAPTEAAQSEFVRNFEDAPIANSFASTYSDSRKEISPATGEISGGENASKSSIEPTACPFCGAENEPNAFVCGACRTILTLSDMEMLLAHTEADREALGAAVERMEAEKMSRQFSAGELKTLGIGLINLKNLRQGVGYLQKAAQLNPNDVVLASKVNFLKIRLSEIEQQEINSSAMTKGRKILIVDDSATVRKLISSKLEKSGHEVLAAVDGIDALEKIKAFTPDLILLDIMMPQLDGYQVCKLIRTNESTKDVPIVMISGKDGFFDKVRGRMAGTTGYITKPFGPETLMKTVETYITRRGAMTPEEEAEE